MSQSAPQWPIHTWPAASHAAGTAAEQAADRKCLKYTELAVETHEQLSVSTVSFLVDLGRKISERLANRSKYRFYSSGSVS